MTKPLGQPDGQQGQPAGLPADTRAGAAAAHHRAADRGQWGSRPCPRLFPQHIAVRAGQAVPLRRGGTFARAAYLDSVR